MRPWPVWSAGLRLWIRTSTPLSIWIRPWSPLRLWIRSAASFRLWVRTGTSLRQWMRSGAPFRLWIRTSTPSRQWIRSGASPRLWIRTRTRWALRIRIQSAALRTPRPNCDAGAKERCGRAAGRSARARALCGSTMIDGATRRRYSCRPLARRAPTRQAAARRLKAQSARQTDR
jgi:hypothetical protein